ncbi:MAG: mercury methylation corrinoid protein HgcA [Spirochaetia bacterium]
MEKAVNNEAPVAFVKGSVTVKERAIPIVSTRLSWRDVVGGWKVRWDIGRMRYRVRPGLYGVGSPSPESPVLVTANYKLTFDRLRRELEGIDAWILVLDTRGINVWCAAGKGTFGTRELEQRILAVRLDQVVSHRTLILPQLGASGVAAHEVKEATGFRVKYGPVMARDIPAYLAAGLKKVDAMRAVPFRLGDRMAIAPAELMHAWPFLLAILAGSALLSLPFAAGYLHRFLGFFIPLVGAVLLATLGFPALLPFLPFRAFALKGAVLGALWSVLAAFILQTSLPGGAAMVLMTTPLVAFIAMNFTGASTFTCQPGAALEVRLGTIPMIASLVIGVGLAITARILSL